MLQVAFVSSCKRPGQTARPTSGAGCRSSFSKETQPPGAVYPCNNLGKSASGSPSFEFLLVTKIGSSKGTSNVVDSLMMVLGQTKHCTLGLGTVCAHHDSPVPMAISEALQARCSAHRPCPGCVGSGPAPEKSVFSEGGDGMRLLLNPLSRWFWPSLRAKYFVLAHNPHST
jgi:hypothetical protein